MSKQLLIKGLQLLPSGIFQKLCQFSYHKNLLKIARLGVKNRAVTIKNGIGAELKFNCGESNPDGALGIYEIPVQETLAKYLKPGNVFYDIGANVGFFTIIAAKLVGKTGKIYAFEPAPDNANLIRINVKLNDFNYVTVIEKAVSNSSQKGGLLLDNYCGGHILAEMEHSTYSKKENTIPVDVISIDDLIERATLSPPNLVKIDVEGAEINVLQGMTQTINKYQPILIYEIDDNNKKKIQQKQEKIDTFVRNLGYKITSLEDSYPDIGWNVSHVIATPK